MCGSELRTKAPYPGNMLGVIWDMPDGKLRFEGEREGFTVKIDGRLALHRQRLEHARGIALRAR